MCIKYVWKIVPKETPIIEKKCNRCHNNQFICSERFRINSNKKLSDVWLIYKCTHCHSTWNMDILTRANLSRINTDLFSLFQKNNVDLAWQYAFDKSILQSNNVRMYKNARIDIMGEVELIFQANEKFVFIVIESKYELTISIKKVLQQKLVLSGKQLDQLYQYDTFIINNDKRIDLSRRIGFGCTIQINIEVMDCFVDI